MKYSILVRGTDVKYIHQSGHTKENAERIAALLNNAADKTETDAQAIVMTDEEAQAAMKENVDTPYFVILEDGHVTFIEITPEMQNEIDTTYKGEVDDYFAIVICEVYCISLNNCQWSLTSESQISCYGKVLIL